MALHVHNLTFDCADARALGTFWSRLTGWNLYYDDDPEVVVAPSFPYDGVGMLFIPVPEGKTAKNRLHLDLQPDTGTRDEAVERAVALGARVLGDHRQDDGTGWVVLADPEGNEFCIERGAEERGPAEPRQFRLGT
jgi:predicted enzyme related to lactoylglutathione lyase